jgi:hypothetical protein
MWHLEKALEERFNIRFEKANVFYLCVARSKVLK